MPSAVDKRKSLGISLKTSMISGIIVLVLLSGISVFLLHLEAGLVKYILDRHLAKTERTIENYGDRQKASLENKIDTAADISSEVFALHLFEMDREWLKKAVKPYMKIVEIQAIQIINEYGEPFGAVWRGNGVENGQELPGYIRARLGESVERSSYYGTMFVGTIILYFSRMTLETDLVLSKKNAEAEAGEFLRIVNLQVRETKKVQVVAVFIVVVALVLTISVYLRAVVIKPILKCVEFAKKISGGVFSARLDFKSNDEIGQLAFALDDMAESIMTGQAELKNALDNANRAIHLKSEFLANMSHELRTPLNSILLLSKLLAENRERNLLDKQVKLMEMINNSGSELLEMINELLDLAKVEAGMMTVMQDKVFLRDIRDYYYRSFENMALEKGIDFHISIEQGLPEFIVTDGQRLNQVIRNLLSNAFKFTEKGQILLIIARPDKDVGALKKGLSLDNTIGFSVSDTGIGIPEEKLDAIFESFTQVDGSISRKYGGTGLGLSISKEFSHLLEGEVRVRSTEGRGSSFTLYLPFVPDSGKRELLTGGVTHEYVVDEEAPKRMLSEDVPSGISGGREVDPLRAEDDTASVRDDRHIIASEDKSVLIAGSIAGYTKTIPEFFRERGYRVIITELVETSIFLANYYKPDLFLMDANLPDETGWNAVKRLSTYNGTKCIPIFFGFPTPSDGDRRFRLRYCFGTDEKDLPEDSKRNLCLEHGVTMVQNYESQLAKRVGHTNKPDDVSGVVNDPEKALQLLKTNGYDHVVMETTPHSKNEIGFFSLCEHESGLHDIKVFVFCSFEGKNKEIAPYLNYPEDISDEEKSILDCFFREISLFMDDHEVRNETFGRIRWGEEVPEKILTDKKILIVEDDMRSLYTLKSIFEEASAHVIPAVNGEKGLARLEEHPDIDIILMDMIMPGIDGYQAIREIRKQERFSNLPIIAVTAKAMAGDCKKCIESGATDYLAKPVDADKLFSMISIWLEKF